VSTLWLVRHAQASFLESDYDRLSELGHEQARRLGEYFAAIGVSFDRVVTGPRRRQVHTAELVVEAMRAGGVSAPELELLDALDEYRAEEILEAHLPELVREHAELAELFGELQKSFDRRARGRAFDRVLQRVLGMWAEGAVEAAAIESFVAFRARVDRALDALADPGASGQNVAAFSSGGTIGALVASVLGASARTALELGWNLNNASVSEIVWSGPRRSLRRFNLLSHLPDPGIWTHR
jgi:broad specificity phosphatase PhoE